MTNDLINICKKLLVNFFNYSKSLEVGFRAGSFDKKPKINKETKKITTV